MSLKLNDNQLAVLNSGERVRTLAVWIIGRRDNRYALQVCEQLSIKQVENPGDTAITRMIGYLRSDKCDTGIVARLINAHQHATR